MLLRNTTKQWQHCPPFKQQPPSPSSHKGWRYTRQLDVTWVWHKGKGSVSPLFPPISPALALLLSGPADLLINLSRKSARAKKMVNWRVLGWKAESAQRSPTSAWPRSTSCFHPAAQEVNSSYLHLLIMKDEFRPSLSPEQIQAALVICWTHYSISLSAHACHYPQSDKRLQGRPEGLGLQPPGSKTLLQSPGLPISSPIT